MFTKSLFRAIFSKHPAPCSRRRLRRPGGCSGCFDMFRPFSISISSRVKKDDDVLIMMTIWSQWIFSYLFTALGNNAPSLDMMKSGEIGANISARWIMWFCQRGCRSSQCPHNWVDECKLNMSKFQAFLGYFEPRSSRWKPKEGI